MGNLGCELSACLIVRNERGRLADCLSSLHPLVDEIIVYDTGSNDGTVELARSLGARVIEGYWDDDFARARNAALVAATGRWILSIDADDRFTGDPAALRPLLAAENVDGYRVQIDNLSGTDGADSYTSFPLRLFRRDRASWRGQIHERVCHADGSELKLGIATARGLRHIGYADADEARGKAARNAVLGLRELQQLHDAGCADPAELARVLLDLGRSLMACEQRQGAVDAFVGVRDLPLRGPEFVQATDFMARLALGANQPDDAANLVQQLRAAGADAEYCNWLEAQVLAQQGDAVSAYRMLAGVSSLVDPAGRVYNQGQVVEMRALAAALAGRNDDAVADLVEAMSRYGRVAGRGKLLLEWWGDRPLAPLWEQISQYGTTYLDGIQRELSACEVAPV
ncbi:glycosyl transferase family 2 [Jatrophihabitans sp. GAS493]|uniref:glycosyltransferase family 2 protein n=1 Tax=Jatrophihabitans sp. GAS493 TaxID=1907575 RepID=UPI000BC0E5E7|nr:glycosyltransferase family 2 protein [Jatrophihabitans sp. GAS493]SOD71066.1 glycosyl transferase family 2 [Jatrophihabitans sp. GAS493]